MIFLLGCERSGTTWLANILDAHPAVELLMEPFADYAGLFPDVPGRDVSVEGGLADALRSGLEALGPLKYPFVYRRGMHPAVGAAEDRLVRWTVAVMGRLPGGAPRRVQRHQLLNLNRSRVPRAVRARKTPEPGATVVKELRLNLKLPALAEAFPDARYLLMVRHPAPQIASVLRLFDAGRLAELRRALPGLMDAVAAEPRLARYRPLLDGVRDADDTEGRLVAWWAASYDTLVRDARRLGLDYRVVRHEQLAARPAERAETLLEWCGLASTDQVRAYVAHSSSTERGDPGPVDTNRRSAAFARRSLAAVDPALDARVVGALAAVTLAPELERYRRPAAELAETLE